MNRGNSYPMTLRAVVFLTGYLLLACFSSVAEEAPQLASVSWIYAGDFQQAREFIDSHPDALKSRDRHGRTSLHLAVLRGMVELVKLLAERGGDVKVKDGLGNTPLHNAFWKGEAEIARFLIARGASPVEPNSQGFSPLFLGIFSPARPGMDLVVEILSQRVYALPGVRNEIPEYGQLLDFAQRLKLIN